MYTFSQMEFKIRYSNTFIMNLFLIALAILAICYCKVTSAYKHGIVLYILILWAVLAIYRFITYRKYIAFVNGSRPVLVVNENYIYDLVKNIKYNWRDIDEVYEDNAYLYIKLYKPEEYLNNFHSPFKKFMAKRTIALNDKDKTPYFINIDMVNVSAKALLEILERFSTQAMANEIQNI